MADMLATVAELASWREQDLDTASATLALEVATGWIQNATGQRLVAVTNDTVTLRGDRSSVWLPERPVTAVGAVTTTAYGVTTGATLGVHYTILGAEVRRSWGWWPD